MRRGQVIVDTGPLVALLVASETRHRWVEDALKNLPAPLLTCEAVLTETAFLTAQVPEGKKRFFDLLESGLLVVQFSLCEEQAALRKLMQKYADLPMSLADACLVRMAELHPQSSILTLDGHFAIYRKNGRQNLSIICPDL